MLFFRHYATLYLWTKRPVFFSSGCDVDIQADLSGWVIMLKYNFDGLISGEGLNQDKDLLHHQPVCMCVCACVGVFVWEKVCGCSACGNNLRLRLHICKGSLTLKDQWVTFDAPSHLAGRQPLTVHTSLLSCGTFIWVKIFTSRPTFI